MRHGYPRFHSGLESLRWFQNSIRGAFLLWTQQETCLFPLFTRQCDGCHRLGIRLAL